ncbi:hypothetical protein BABINDRAFT_159528 [Babjeviella inositovora NRRL Y-12698]|uniref:Structural maintenance of chromosomes protein n=1 Tax=Babjeviella inositovora NRRL Y-12698 TaxID=984486 RepID=A0A1E3QZJ3_9ASCO|nr:uncharacterized protein BABINDRAFT_159528 [Babjeviella inositovora NRRL Y-12698]ODQ83066.1 hypothetical protein BABINDRAFT_159528 [Babjeviella inositovora NRRL Y-12698]
MVPAAQSSFIDTDSKHSFIDKSGDNPFLDRSTVLDDKANFSIISVPELASDPSKGTRGPESRDARALMPVKLDFSSQLTQIPLSPRKLVSPSRVVVPPRAPRLVIHKLVLTNFKSYAGTQEIGPFHLSFLAVVGPNGSGKSNVIDSMLFVFGFRALKMRQGKLSELIHNSEEHTDLGFCAVDIHFEHVIDDEDSEGATVVSGSGLVVSRKAFRTGGSQYYIDGKMSTYTEVTTLLKAKGIDLDHKRFLILQGEVESIAQMKAKAEKENDDGLLEYLEDIIGTTAYKPQIDVAVARVAELNELCKEKEHRFELVERDKTALEARKDDALAFLEQEKLFVENQAAAHQLAMLHDREAVETNTKVHEELAAELAKEQAETAEFQREIIRLEAAHAELARRADGYAGGIAALQKTAKQLEKDKVSIEEKLRHTAAKQKKAEKALAASQFGTKEAEAKLALLEGGDFEAEIATLQESMARERTALDQIRLELTSKTEVFTQQIEVLRTELQPWQDRLEAKNAQVQIAQSKVDMLAARKTENEAEIEACQARIATLRARQETKTEALAKLRREEAHVAEQIKLGEPECAHHAQTLAKMETHVRDEQHKLQEMESALRASQSKSKLLDGLMRLLQAGRVTGFHGRLGDLGTIDDKYDVAVTTACGLLNDMVVETVAAADACIAHMRATQLGYAKFICLDKIARRGMQPITTPRNVPRLFDLVTPKDPRFSLAFYHALQDTLVARDMQEANAVAFGDKKRWRAVTLDGKLVDKSGTLSGGGRAAVGGGMKSTPTAFVAPEEVAAARETLAVKREKLAVVRTKVDSIRAALQGLRDRQPEVELAISQHELELESMVHEVTNCGVSLAELTANRVAFAADTRAVTAAEAEVARLVGERAADAQQADALQAQIAALQEKIMDVGGVELRIQKSKVDALGERIELATEKRSAEALAARKLTNEIKKFAALIAESTALVETCRGDLQAMEAQSRAKADGLAQTEAALDEAMNERDEVTAELEAGAAALAARRSEIKKLDEAAIELTNKMEKHAAAIRAAQRNLLAIEARIAEMAVRDVAALLDWIPEDARAQYTVVRAEYTLVELRAMDADAVDAARDTAENYMNSVKVDPDVLQEYGARSKEFEARRGDLNAAVEERTSVQKTVDDLKRRRLDEFMEGFNTISLSLKEMYQMITMGGNAELELVDSLDPFSEGILFSVMPPKKSWRNISNLSGGEKTLSSLALVFALHRYKPTPLYVMDEIDAALDFRNVSIVANYIKERTKNAQFIVISLRNNMFELSKQLVGIYKVRNMTKSVALQNREVEAQ